jgi:hypothetical protein
MRNAIFDPVFVKRKQTSLNARYGGARTAVLARTRSPQVLPLGGWFLPWQNRTSIRCLGPVRAVTED